jgi:hypothetical protein
VRLLRLANLCERTFTVLLELVPQHRVVSQHRHPSGRFEVLLQSVSDGLLEHKAEFVYLDPGTFFIAVSSNW